MRNITCWVLSGSLYLLISLSSAASTATDYFQSRASGNWTSIASWRSSPNAGGPWTNATLVPTQAANTITIMSSHVISISTARTFDQLVIKNGGELSLLTGGSITLNNGSGFDITIESGGILSVLSSQPYASTIIPGTSTMSISGTVEIGNNTTNAGTGYEALASNTNNSWLGFSSYIHNSNSAVVSAANASFFPNATTGSPTLSIYRLAGALGNTGSLTVNGQLLMYTDVTIGGVGTKLFAYGFYGDITLTTAATSGTINVGNANEAANIGGNLNLILHKNINIIHNVVLLDASSSGEVKVIDNSSTAKIVISAGRTLTNEGGNTLDMGTDAVITNNGTLNNEGVLRTANSNGLTGSATTSISGGTVFNETYSTVEYYGSSQAVTAITYGNLTLSGSGTKTAGTFNLATNGELYITGSAILDATGNIGPVAANTTSLVMNANSRFILRTSGTQPNMQGTYTLSGNSVVEFANNNATAQAIRNGTTKVYHHIDISGNNVGNASANIYLNASGIFKVTATGIFYSNSNSIQAQAATSGQSITLVAGGVFKVYNQAGFNGTTATAVHNTITSFNVAAGSTVEYARSGDQNITNANSLQYGNLALSGSGTKTAPATTLTVRGNLLKNTASFAHNNGTVVMSGTTIQNYTSGIPFMKFYNFTNNNTVDLSINSGLSIEKEMAIGASSILNLRTGANIILLSTASGTANVGVIPSSATVGYAGTGKFTIERYIPTGPIPGHAKSWQFLAIPTNGGQTINQAWQDTATAANQNRYSGYGTQLTSDISPLPAQFDVYTPLGPSLKTYTAASNSWVGAASTTTTPMYNSKGYMVFVRGDRTVTTYNASANPTILRSSGRIFWPGSNLPTTISVSANKFESIGNPYASAINFSNDAGVVKSANIQKAFYVWDPKLGGSNGYGAWQTFTRGVGADNNYYVSPGGGSYGAIGSINNTIQSGQAFMVRASGGAGTVSFSETAKTTGSSNTFRGGPVAYTTTKLFIQLKQVATGNTFLLDGSVEEFGRNLDNELDPSDTYKFRNSSEYISIGHDQTELAVERRDYPVHRDTIFLKTGNMRFAQYQLYFTSTRLDNWDMDAFLIDNYLQTVTLIDLLAGTAINFSVNNDVASYAANRFAIVFKLKRGLYPSTEYSFERVLKKPGFRNNSALDGYALLGVTCAN